MRGPGLHHSVVDSPVGPLTLVGRDGSLVVLYLPDHRHAPGPDDLGPRRDDTLSEVVVQLADYFAGRRTTFDLRLDATGTPFQHRVWDALARIPYATTCTYGQLAAGIGRPSASRAVGLANGRNPLSIVVPCHRVIGADGRLTGYGGGLAAKAQLLALEHRTLSCAGR